MRRKLAGIAIALGLVIAAPARAESWSCVYDGNWRMADDSDKGVFNWNVVWQSTGNGWQITGDYSDRYGQSVLDGNCSDRACSLTQVYQTGELKGKKYYWKGKYSDESRGNGRTVNRFTGSWGTTPGVGDGSWRATATCTRN